MQRPAQWRGRCHLQSAPTRVHIQVADSVIEPGGEGDA